MSQYTANLRDLEVNLSEFLDTEDRFGTGPFAQMDAETAGGVPAEIRRLAEGPIAASFADADRDPPVFDPATHSVTLPEHFEASVRAIEDGDWFALHLPEHLGGFGVSLRTGPAGPCRGATAPHGGRRPLVGRRPPVVSGERRRAWPPVTAASDRRLP